jgi:hypothetical protein
MQVQYKKNIAIINYIIVAILFFLCVWYLNINRSMVVRLDPLTNTFIFMHIVLLFSTFSVGVYCCYMYYKMGHTYDIINGSINFILSIISIYFTIKNINNTDLIMYPNTNTFIQEFQYLDTLGTFDSILLLIMIGLTLYLLFYNINYSYTHKYLV